MRTVAGTPPNSSITMPVGRMDIFYSDNARRNVATKIPPGQFQITRLSWTQDDSLPVGTLWTDTADQ